MAHQPTMRHPKLADVVMLCSAVCTRHSAAWLLTAAAPVPAWQQADSGLYLREAQRCCVVGEGSWAVHGQAGAILHQKSSIVDGLHNMALMSGPTCETIAATSIGPAMPGWLAFFGWQASLMWGLAGHHYEAAAAAAAAAVTYCEGERAACEIQLKGLLAAVALHVEVHRGIWVIHRHLQSQSRVRLRG